MDICEPHIAPGKPKRQFFVVDAKQVEHGGVQIMNVNFVLDRFVAVFIGGTVNHASFDSAASHPDGKPKWIMIAAIGALSEGSAAKFSTQMTGLIEETRLLRSRAVGNG
jgi:hypothetical protein